MIRLKYRCVLLVIVAAHICLGSFFVSKLLAADQKELRTITGRVTNEAGEGLAGAIVDWGPTRYYRFKARQHVLTDADGRYSITLKEYKEPCRLRAYLPGYISEDIMSTLNNKREPGHLVLTPTPATGHTAYGIVVDKLGETIPNVKVEAYTPIVGFHSSFSMPSGRDHFSGPDRIAITDSQGRFRIADLPKTENNQVHLSLRAKHRHANDANYSLEKEIRIFMRGSGKPGVLRGQLLDSETGKPVPITQETRIIRRYTTKAHRFSNDTGWFQLPDTVTLASRQIVYIYTPGYAAHEAQLVGANKDAEDFTKIYLKKMPALRGRLIDAQTGRPIKEATLLYAVGKKSDYFSWSNLEEYADGYHAFSYVQRDQTDEQGKFWFAEPEHSYGMIIVWAKGYQRLRLDFRAREIDQETGELLIRLHPESALTGIVTQNGIPLKNVSVRLSATGQTYKDFPYSFESTRTDEQGRYTFGQLFPGTYRVRAGGISQIGAIKTHETTALNLTGQLGTLRIYGKAIGGVTINLTPKFEWEYHRFTTTADSEGKYEFQGLKAGKYEVMFHFPSRGGYISRDTREITVEQDDQQMDFSQPIAGATTLKID